MASTEFLLSPSRVTSAVLPSGVKATWLGPDFASPSASLPAGVSVMPAIVKMEIVPSARLATNASVAARLIETPEAPCPAVSDATTLRALRSITGSASLDVVFVGSAGSIFVAPVTSAKDSSGATATLCGGPTTLAGASTVGGEPGGETVRAGGCAGAGAGGG